MPSAEEDAAALAELLARSAATRDLAAKIDAFVTKLKRRRFDSSMELTRETLYFVRLLVHAKSRWASPLELLQVIRAFGRRLVKARPVELVVGNVFRRVIHSVKEEYFNMLKEQNRETPEPVQDESASNDSDSYIDPDSLDPKDSLLPSREIGLHDISFAGERAGWNLRGEISEAIDEMLSELENVAEPISKQALEHIHADDVVLVYGDSGTVEVFLTAAKRKRSFKVIVAEAAPEFSGHRMANKLSALGIPTVLISDSAIFAMMARVNKVIIGTHAVMANGGLIAAVGAHLVGEAAKVHSVPVLCVTGLYKLCPLFPYNLDAFIDLKSPGPTSAYADLGGASDLVQVVSPSFDYVPPDLVSLFITNTGGHQPSYIYRLLSEYYDINAEEEL
mmetsp:Transcript_19720/g.49831  ORF Transcript_19720/g.49831 Transcript_19720/m.49831 type:complete len:392 (-) Transcript_19720:53-1228(-)